MENIFLKLLNMSITAGWLILAVIVLRLLLKKAPRWISCLLWALVAVRLICPVSLESIFSVIPSSETIQRNIVYDDTVNADNPGQPVSNGLVINSGMEFVDNMANPMFQESPVPKPESGADPLQAWLGAAGVIWAAGAGIILLYAVVSYIRLYLRIRTAVRLQGIIYQSEFVDTPFIFGVLRPRIYLPSGMPEEIRIPVIAHEQAHLQRFDNYWKILGYALLTVYWFHPLCWAAYILFCKDMEMACDEKVIRNYSARQKKEYSEALLTCSLSRKTIVVCPLAFGEVSVRERIQSVLHYRKPAFWLTVTAVIVCVAAGFCFLTDPVEKDSLQSSVAEPEEGSTGGISENISAGPDEAGNPKDDGTGREMDSPSEMVSKWVSAFVRGNGDEIAAMVSEKVMADFEVRGLLTGPEGQRAFGESDFWPVDEEKDVRVKTVDDGYAEIYYYAWSREPHVTVWKESISYEQQDGRYVITSEELARFENISSAETFDLAYGYYPIDGTRIDYAGNGAGEELNSMAQLNSAERYRRLLEPESAVTELLNLSDDPAEVKVEAIPKGYDMQGVTITFLKDEVSVKVGVVQPYGEGGIWVPQDYRVNPLNRFMGMDWQEIKSRNLSPENPDWWDVICMGRIPEKGIFLYGYNDEECSFQGAAIEIGGKVNYFDWIYSSPRSLLPEYYWDETTQRLQVALNIYTGTGAAAQSLHVLQLKEDGSLRDNAFELDSFSDILSEKIQFVFDEESRLLTLTDSSSQKQLAVVPIEEGKVTDLELGVISEFILGETIMFRVETGYYRDGSYAVAEYENMPELLMEVLLRETEDGIEFDLGDIIVTSQP